MEFIPRKSVSARTTDAVAGENESVSAPELPASVALTESKSALEVKVRIAMAMNSKSQEGQLYNRLQRKES
jgi:hypothetical protein